MEEARKLNWAKLPGPVLSLVRASCSSLLHGNPHVQIDEAALDRYVDELDHTKLEKLPKKMYPLHFPTQRSEINFLSTLALLQFGSGWREDLHAQDGGKGKGAAETMTFGCIGMHISGEINADAMLRMGISEVAQTFRLKITEEYEIQPGIRTERKTNLWQLAQHIVDVLHAAGGMLRNLACNDFADFYLNHPSVKVQEIDPVTNEPRRPSAEQVVTRLVRHFTPLQDAYVLPPRNPSTASAPVADAGSSADASATPATAHESASSSVTTPQGERVVYLLKKAQLMVAEVYLRFHDEDPRFNYSDISSLTVFSDNVLPAVLRAKGILRYSDELAKKVDEGSLIKNREEEASIRAAAVEACERIVQKYNEKHEHKHRQSGLEAASIAATAPAPLAGAVAAAAAGSSAHAADPPLTPLMLDYHLWLSGKQPELRKLRRHATYSFYY